MSIKCNCPCDIDGICPYEAQYNRDCEYWCGAEEPEDYPSEDYFADEYEELEQLPMLNLEYIPHRNDYRVFDPKYPQQTVAYVDSIAEAWHQHPEYRYVIV